MEELKKCPFCGGEAIAETDVPVWGTITVGCENKKCRVRPCITRWTFEEATDAWNERA
ncbi:Lar family restriction alleviation protein [Lachnospiraceae bacterium 38-10]